MKKYRFTLNEHFKKILSYRQRNIYDIEHSVTRFHERFPELTDKDYFNALQDGIDIILQVFKDSTQKYIIISKKRGFGIQLDWRKDKKSRDNINQGYTATTLDVNLHKKLLANDRKLFVEEIKKYNLQEWFKSGLTINEVMKETGYIDIKLPECDNYVVYLNEGELHKNFSIIEVN